ncbi:MAG: hypothetical protein ABSD68_03275 [Candidatus Micrarchaeales archaeon]|jgi:hypothetical protein
MHRIKAQSAMEYLMTYGWAILIIAVVLGALFSLGVFSGASLIGTSCIASSGFYCSGLTYVHSAPGVFTVTIGQSTGINWNAPAIIILAPQGSSMGTDGPKTPSAAYANTITGGLIAGQQSTVSWTIGTSAVGAPIAGTIWACYAIGSGSVTGYTYGTGICSGTSVQYTKMAVFTAKAN